MNNSPNKLAEYAAPTRGRVKYAPLTAGLLARKGEAIPATPYYAAEALDLYTAGPIVVARHEPAAHETELHARRHSNTPEEHRPFMPPRAPHWRMRRAMPIDAENGHSSENAEPRSQVEHARAQARSFLADHISLEVEQARRVSISLSLDLELLARLALHARHGDKSLERLIADLLKSALRDGEGCPICEQAFAEPKS